MICTSDDGKIITTKGGLQVNDSGCATICNLNAWLAGCVPCLTANFVNEIFIPDATPSCVFNFDVTSGMDCGDIADFFEWMTIPEKDTPKWDSPPACLNFFTGCPCIAVGLVYNKVPVYKIRTILRETCFFTGAIPPKVTNYNSTFLQQWAWVGVVDNEDGTATLAVMIPICEELTWPNTDPSLAAGLDFGGPGGVRYDGKLQFVDWKWEVLFQGTFTIPAPGIGVTGLHQDADLNIPALTHIYNAFNGILPGKWTPDFMKKQLGTVIPPVFHRGISSDESEMSIDICADQSCDCKVDQYRCKETFRSIWDCDLKFWSEVSPISDADDPGLCVRSGETTDWEWFKNIRDDGGDVVQVEYRITVLGDLCSPIGSLCTTAAPDAPDFDGVGCSTIYCYYLYSALANCLNSGDDKWTIEIFDRFCHDDALEEFDWTQDLSGLLVGTPDEGLENPSELMWFKLVKSVKLCDGGDDANCETEVPDPPDPPDEEPCRCARLFKAVCTDGEWTVSLFSKTCVTPLTAGTDWVDDGDSTHKKKLVVSDPCWGDCDDGTLPDPPTDSCGCNTVTFTYGPTSDCLIPHTFNKVSGAWVPVGSGTLACSGNVWTLTTTESCVGCPGPVIFTGTGTSCDCPPTDPSDWVTSDDGGCATDYAVIGVSTS